MGWTASRRSVALVAAIGVLLPALAVLQYRWLGELSGLEQLRARQNLEAATVRLSTEFDARLARIYAGLSAIDASETLDAGTGSADADARRRDAFQALAPGGFVKEIHVVDRAASGALSVRAFDPTTGALRAHDAPAWIAALDQRTAVPALLNRTLLDEVPAIVVRSPASPGRWIAAELDLDHIANDLIPEMLAGCFEGGIPSALDVLIIRDDLPDEAVYRSSAHLVRADFRDAASPVPLFAIHGRDLDVSTARRLMPDAAAHRWRLYLQHQSGALEATLGAVRVRNLAIGLGVLVLLAVSVGLLVASMHSMQRAAREQLELVARISHELRTPLATITCAGENLADDVLGSPVEARHYGELIKREGRRLTRTIGDILLCCRLQARPHAVLNRQPTDVADVVARAVLESRSMAPPDQVIDTTIEPGLPVVLADRDALKAALKNLVGNAIKYGAGGRVRVSAKAQRSAAGSDVVISVEDDGPGIPVDEHDRIFEPFFRGRVARDLEIEGSGIGLNIVRQVARAHGGRVRVASSQPQGARFVLQLPAMRAVPPLAAAEPAA